MRVAWQRFASRSAKPGAPPLLLVHGFGCGISEWSVLPRRLALRSQRDIIAFDHRGVGRSLPAARGPYTVPMLADDALGVMDAAGVDRAHVLGISLGGMVAQQMALTEPERVSGLILGCTAHGGSESTPPPPSFMDVCSDVAAVGNRAGESNPAIDAFIRSLMPGHTLEGDAGARLFEQFQASFVATPRDPVGLQGQLAALMRFNSTRRLHALACPTLVITGDEDTVLPFANAESLAAKVPGARLVRWDGAGHFWWQHRTVEVCDLLSRFLLDQADAACT